MNAIDVKENILTLFSEASQDLLRGMNCEVSVLEDSLDDELDAPLAFIDAGSSDLEIQVGLELPMTVLALTYPVPSMADVDDESLEDWISELSNQLMGRLKSKLIKHGQEITLGLPSTYFGVNLESVLSASQTHYTVNLNVDGEACTFHLGIETIGSDITYNEEETEGDVLMESELELF